MIPLELTSKEQEFFAELCSILRSWWYECAKHGVTSGNSAVMSGRVADLLWKYEYKSQDLDRFYDLMHRSGANS